MVANNSNTILRNLAYELSSLDAPTHIAPLALFYGSMVKNLEDLKYIYIKQKLPIRHHFVNNQQVLHLIRALAKDLSILQVDDLYIKEQMKHINSYLKSISYKLYQFNHQFPLR